MTSIPDFVYKPWNERTEEELRETIKMQNAAIKKHNVLAKWGNVDSRMRLREIRAAKKKAEEALRKLTEKD